MVKGNYGWTAVEARVFNLIQLLATVEVTLTPADALGYFRWIVKKRTVYCLLLFGDLTEVKAEMLCLLLSRDLASSFDRVVCRQLLLATSFDEACLSATWAIMERNPLDRRHRRDPGCHHTKVLSW